MIPGHLTVGFVTAASGVVGPGEVWRAWSLDPLVVTGLIAAATLYGTGLGQLWRSGRAGRGIRRWQASAFGAGLLAIAVALVSPLDAMAEALLSAHMVQHLLLLVVAPPLLVAGRPLIAAAAARPAWRRPALGAVRRPWVRRAGRLLGHPLLAWFLAPIALWTWHLPPLYEAALANGGLHALEHASFLGTGILFWWTALRTGGRRRLARGADVLFVVTGALPGATLGALITFASSPLYGVYASSSQAWGTGPLQDQQWAGANMWIPSGLVYLGVAGALFVGWLRAMDRDAEREEARLSRFGSARPGSLTASSESAGSS